MKKYDGLLKNLGPEIKSQQSPPAARTTSRLQPKISQYFAKANRAAESDKGNSSDDDVVFISATPPRSKKRKLKDSPEGKGESSRVRKLSKQDENRNIDEEQRLERNLGGAKVKEETCQNKEKIVEKRSKFPLLPTQIRDINRFNPFKESFDKEPLSSFYGLGFPESKTTSSLKPLERFASTSTCEEETQTSELDSFLEDEHDFFDDNWLDKPELALDNFQRCIVTEIVLEPKQTILTVRDEKNESQSKVHCSGNWRTTDVEQNDIISIKAVKEGGNWVVNNDKGFIVVKPDTLLSITTVVGSLFCPRKSVLTEKFRRMEGLPFYESDDGIALIGKLVHQLLQDALCRKITTQNDIYDIVEEMMNSRETAVALYACDMSSAKCREEVRNFVPQIFDFLQHYMQGNPRSKIENTPKNFKGEILEVKDIEENIWLPRLGLKGKIDVTAEVKIHSRKRLMPLEVKTGRTSYSFEHKGQIILYVMMMALTGQEVDSGLLLYIRENSMQEVASRHLERRDLISLRNTLANYFSAKAVENPTEIEKVIDLPLMPLPEPINHSFCSKCIYNTLCCTFLSKDEETKIPESLVDVSKTVLEKLAPAHIQYVMNWISLLQLEELAQASENRTKDLWTLTPEKREAKGNCIAYLTLQKSTRINHSRFIHSFCPSSPSIVEFSPETIANFTDDEYVLISTESRTNIASGFVTKLRREAIEIALDRDLSKFPATEFHVDKNFYSNLNLTNFANLAGLLHDGKTSEKLRRIIIDKEAATFARGIEPEKVRSIARYLKGLNKDQINAIVKALTAKDYMLIKGMPGTGKTQTLVALILALNALGHSVLISAHTNSAVDNILLKLVEKGASVMRLGATTSIHSGLKHYSEAYLTSECTSPESLAEVYKTQRLIGVTCYGANHSLLSKKMFDYCIIDESAQVMQPTILRPLFNATVFILAGDPDQLPPVVKSATARRLGADETLFSRLDSGKSTILLGKQYRMNQSIMHLANKLTYRDKLSAANDTVNFSTFLAGDGHLEDVELWQRKILSPKLEEAVIVVDTGCTYARRASDRFLEKYSQDEKMYSNVWEAALILRFTENLIEMSVTPNRIGVIAPYRMHVLLLRKVLHADIEVNTVDQYQGRDKDIIFYSCSRSFQTQVLSDTTELKQDKKRDLEILEDHRRLTVAVTRAKHKLIIIADRGSIVQYTPFKKLFDIVGEKHIVKLKDDCGGFSWKSVTYSL